MEGRRIVDCGLHAFTRTSRGLHCKEGDCALRVAALQQLQAQGDSPDEQAQDQLDGISLS